MDPGRIALIFALVIAGGSVAGCGSSESELPNQEKIQQQLKRDADMRAEEDRLEKEEAKP
jgi:hypothetical protein